MKEYQIKKIQSGTPDWDHAEKLEVSDYKWMDNDYRPKVLAALLYDETAIYIKYWVYETEIRAEHKNHGEMVCQDSCVEFFLQPKKSPDFINFECSVIGKMLIGIGPKRHGRTEIPVDDEVLKIKPSVKDPTAYKDDMWTVTYRIPFDFLRKFYGDLDIVGDGIRANVFKCGDYTRFEHYGMWNPVLCETPDFHKPECFGMMTFEK